MANMFVPDEFNTARPNNYKLTFQKLPNTMFHLQNVTLPTVTMQEVDVSNPMLEWQLPDTHISYANLDVSFLIDESFSNWNEIHAWMMEIWNPESGGSTNDLRNLHTEATLHILSNNGNSIKEIEFHNIFPISLSAVEMTTQAEAEPIICDVEFSYTHFNMI